MNQHTPVAGTQSPFSIPSVAEAANQAALTASGEIFDGLGRRRIIHPDYVGKDNPKYVSYSRVTTFIEAIDDKTALQKWRTRLILEGSFLSEVQLERSVIEAWDILESADDREAALKIYRATLDEIADRAFFFAGGHEAADYGTSLHSLAEAFHGGVLTEELLEQTESTWPGIVDDFHAYVDAWNMFVDQTGATVVHSEVLVVDDKMGLAGRTDLVLLAKLPGDQRARRVIFDLKTGKVDNEVKLAQQMDLYSGSKLYDPETGVRSHLRARRDFAIVAHVPRGQRAAHFKLINLAEGRKANRLCLEVRMSRRRKPGISTLLVSTDQKES